MLTGPSGAARSTVAAHLATLRNPGIVIGADTFAVLLGRAGISLAGSARQRLDVPLTQCAAATAGRFVRSGYWTVYDGVLPPSLLPTFAAAAELERLHYAVLLPAERIDRLGARCRRDHAAARHAHRAFAEVQLAERHVVRGPTDEITHVTGVLRRRLEDGELAVWL